MVKTTLESLKVDEHPVRKSKDTSFEKFDKSNRKFQSCWTRHHEKVSDLLVTAPIVGLIC